MIVATLCLVLPVLAAEGEATRKFSDIEIDSRFESYLVSNPLLMEVTGAKVIRLAKGRSVVLGVASTPLKDDSGAVRLRAEKVCRAKALASIVAEHHGVQVAHVEKLEDRTVVVLKGKEETATSVSELLQITKIKVEGVAKDMPVVGRWKSKNGEVLYLAIGMVCDLRGDPTDEGSVATDKPMATTLVAVGVGKTPEAALKSALQDAVRQAVGTLLDAETAIRNDEVIEDKILALSGGFVSKYDELSTKLEDGLVRVKIRAVVQQQKLLASLKAANVSIKEIKGKDLFAEAATKAEDAQNAAEMLARIFAGYPANVIKAEVLGAPRVKNAGKDTTEVGFDLAIGVDKVKYDVMQQRLVQVLDRISEKKGEFSWNGASPDFNISHVKRQMYKPYRGFVGWFGQSLENEILAQLKRDDDPLKLRKIHSFSTGSGGDAKHFGSDWWKSKPSNGEMPIIVNTWRSQGDDRTKWKWFHVPQDLIQLKPGFKLSIEFKGDEDSLLAKDELTLEGNSPGLMIHGQAVIFSPFWVCESEGYTSTVTLSRTTTASLEEIKRIKEVRCETQPGSNEWGSRRNPWQRK